MAGPLAPGPRRLDLRVWAPILLFLLSGCAGSPQSRLLDERPPAAPSRVELEQVPFFPQQQYHCGPAALASVLGYRGLDVAPERVAELVYVPGLEGSLQVEIVAAARRFGMLPVRLPPRLEALIHEIAAGNPVFVLQNLGLDSVPVWHYEVVVGYDLEAAEFILRSGTERRVARRFALFEKTWRRAGFWALAVVEADRIPESVDADAWLDAVIGAEQVGLLDIARQGYGVAARRWPDNPVARGGLGNTAYAQGEYLAALQAFRSALELAPDDADLWNNLAYTLARLGRHEASIDAIHRALQLRPDDANLRHSLEQLSRAGG